MRGCIQPISWNGIDFVDYRLIPRDGVLLRTSSENSICCLPPTYISWTDKLRLRRFLDRRTRLTEISYLNWNRKLWASGSIWSHFPARFPSTHNNNSPYSFDLEYPRMPVSSAKATKKSAFSCDQCRKRKVKCDGHKPTCVRCTRRSETCEYKLSPTLSYTQKLENKVKALEHALSIAEENGSTSDTAEQSPSSTSTAAALPPAPTKRYFKSIKGLKLDRKGAITYHGATSFFQLPSSDLNEAFEGKSGGAFETLDEGNRRKEKLVNNAWQQRALERFLETPVCHIIPWTCNLCWHLVMC